MVYTIPEQGRNEGGHNFPLRRVTVDDDEKSQQCHTYFLQYSKFGSERAEFRTKGAPNLLIVPGAI